MDLGIISLGVESSLSDGALSYLRSWEGIGPADIETRSSSGPQQAGDSRAGFKYQPRYLTFEFGLAGANPSDLDSKRAAFYNAIQASDLERKLVFYLDSGLTRFIYADFYTHKESIRTGRKHQVIAVTFKASDPFFYGDSHDLTFGQSAGAGGFSVPTPVPTPVGSSDLGESTIIYYQGSIFTFPSIRITGPITDPVIWNYSINKKIDFTGVTLSGGEYIDINLAYGVKKALDQSGAYVAPSSDSNLSDFRIAQHPIAQDGANEFYISGSGAGVDTRVDVAFWDRYNFI